MLSKDTMQIGSIETHLFHQHRNSSCLKYKSLQHFSAGDTTGSLDILWKSAWMLKPQRPLWNGFMQMVHKGEHPGQSSVIFMPIIDMKSSDESWILSTMHFVTEQARHYNTSPILTLSNHCTGKELKFNKVRMMLTL